MPNPQRAISRRSIHAVILPVVAFGLIYLYVWLRIDPRLVYHRQGPIFLVGSGFFKRFLDHPGGLIEYVCALLSQFYTYPLGGALIVTAVAGFICLATRAFITKLGGTGIPVLYLLPAIPLLMLHNRYDYPLTASLGLLTTLLFVSIYGHVFLRNAALQLVVFLLLSAVLYYAAAGPCLLFMVLCGLLEFLIRERLSVCLPCFLCALVGPYVASTYVFDIPVLDAYVHLLPFQPDAAPSVPSLALYGFFLLVAIIVPLRRPADDKAPSATDTTAPSPPAGSPEAGRRSRFEWVYQSLLLLAVGAGAVFLSFNRDEKTSLQVDYYARHGTWPQVLHHARRLPARAYGLTTHWDVNRALFHTGRLADEMFSYPQRRGAKPEYASSLMCSHFTGATDRLPLAAKPILGEVFLELGRVGEAEFRANEALVWFGDRPSTIERLFLIHLVKRERDPAKTFLNALGRHLLWKDRARDYRRRIEQDPFLDEDEDIKHIRSIMIDKDKLGALPVETMLQDLLEKNRRNRMAFEYLMGHYLLTRQIEEIARNIGRLDDFEYNGIPRPYEEAVLLHMRARPNRHVDLHGREINPDTRRRFEAFMELYERHRGDKQAAQAALIDDYVNSYLFYYRFGFSGHGRTLAASLLPIGATR